MKLLLAIALLGVPGTEVSRAPAAAAAQKPATPATAAPTSVGAGPRMGQALLSRSLPAYPGATSDTVPVGDTIEAKGVPMNVQSFMTNDPPRKVLDFYEAFFKKAGLRLIGNGDMVVKFPYPSVTAMDEETDIDISVITVPSEDRRTMVLLARADMQPLLQNLDRVEAERYGGMVPYPHGANASAVHFTDGEVRSTQVTFDTTDAPDQVLAFYKKALGNAQAAPDGTLTFRQPDGIWRVAARAQVAGARTVVTAVHTDVNGDPVEGLEHP